MRRFFVSPEDVGEETIVIDDREDIRHMKKVLRLSKGDEIDISDSTEWEYRTEIILLDDEKRRLGYWISSGLQRSRKSE